MNNKPSYSTFAKRMKTFFIILFFTLGISICKAEETSKMFSLYPVPLKTSKLVVKRNTDNANNIKIAKVELRNLIGKKLQGADFDKNTEEVVFEDMDSYPNGIYVVLAFDSYGKIIESSKFIINR